MALATAPLPETLDELRLFAVSLQSEMQREIAARDAELYAKTLHIEKLKMQLAKLRRMQFGQSSERLNRQIEQLELQLEELEATEAQAEANAEASGQVSTRPERMKPKRRPLPDHLPRQDVVHEPADACTCSACCAFR